MVLARFYASHRLTERLVQRPDGSLLALSVPIARTGKLEYKPAEVEADLAAGAGDVVVVHRMAEDLFSDATMASYEGLPFVLGHPEGDVDVTPENWKDLAKGHVQNVRRGQGDEADLLLADIVISDAEAIQRVLVDNIREISAGYDANCQVLSPGVGRQIDNRGNHIALVEHGRNGPRVAIRDHNKEAKLAKPTTPARRDAEPDDKPKVADQNPNPDEGKAAPVTDEGDGETQLMLRTILDDLQLIKTALKVGVADEDPEDKPAQVTDSEKDKPLIEDEGNASTEAKRDRRTTGAVVRDAKILAPGMSFREGDSVLMTQRAALGVEIGRAHV